MLQYLARRLPAGRCAVSGSPRRALPSALSRKSMSTEQSLREPQHGKGAPRWDPFFDTLDSIGLTKVVARLNHGRDIGGQPIGSPTAFHSGVVRIRRRRGWTTRCDALPSDRRRRGIRRDDAIYDLAALDRLPRRGSRDRRCRSARPSGRSRGSRTGTPRQRCRSCGARPAHPPHARGRCQGRAAAEGVQIAPRAGRWRGHPRPQALQFGGTP